MRPALCLALLLLSLPALARDYGRTLVSEIVSIYDGDTFTVNIAHWPALVGERISVRINGIDTPELRGKCQKEKDQARAAKQFTVDRLRNARTVELHNLQRDKYFRILSDVYVDGQSLADALLAKGFAIPYHGGSKRNWCDA